MMYRRRPGLAAAAALLATAPAAAYPPRLELDLGDHQRLSLVLVRAGTFRQGSPAAEAGRAPDEAPRDVTVTRDFYLGEVPVLRGQYARFAAATGYRTESETGRSGGYGFDGRALAQRPEFNWRSPGFAQTDEHPAVILTFDDAQRFTSWASAQTGRVVRLPTEAEWELACRAGTATAFFNGDGETAGRAAGWFREGSGNGTRPVRGRAPNAVGLYDMVGHVQQWVADWYAPYPPGAAADPMQTVAGSPPGEPARRVMRGGSWLRSVNSGRCAARSRATPGSRNADTGLRVAVDAEAPPPLAAPATSLPAPAPFAPPPAVDATPPPPDEGGGFGCATAAAVLGALGLGAWLVRRGGTGAVKLTPLADGFRVKAPAAFAGRVIRCRYTAGGRPSEAAVTYEHSDLGQFVYTGAMPSALKVVGLDAAPSYASSGYRAPPSSGPSHHHHHHHQDASYSPPTPAPWSGYDPPAY
jgi:formylglycine-generating enzyme required for sulfatase activity